MLTSKELLEQTGISRATLNNYISWGIVPRPEVLPPEPRDGAAPRIGYFPDEVVKRIAEIKRLKADGWSITRIAEQFASGPAPAAAGAGSKDTARPAPSGPAAASPAPAGLAARPEPERAGMPPLSIADIAHPAYIVNHRFELLWLNAAAGGGVLRNLPQTRAGTDSRNVFKHLVGNPSAGTNGRQEVLRFHLGLAKLHGASLTQICREVSEEWTGMLERLYDEVKRPESAVVSHCFVPTAAVGGAHPSCIYAVQFREGILIVHVPGGRALEDLPPLLVHPDLVVGGTLGKRLPKLSHVAVLAADLEHPTRIWTELPPEEYFELINQIWLAVDPIFRRHHGTHGKHPGDGLVCYFFPQRDSNHVWNAILAAHEMREAMRRVSKAWQLRKGWATELYMNTGLDEGQQWLGTLKSAGEVEFTMLSGTLNRAARISDFARLGAIWATKNLIGKLTPEEKQRLKFGVSRKSGDGREIFVSSVFSNVDSLATDPPGKLTDIARLPIAEIVEIAHDKRERAVDQAPI